MTTELANVNQAALPAFARKHQSNLLDDMKGGLSDSIPMISLAGSRFTFMKDGAELGKADTLHLDVIIVGATTAIQRTYYAGAYDPDKKDVQPDCTSHEGNFPDANVKNKQAATCQTCPQNVKQPDPKDPRKERFPCGFSKDIAVMIPGDATATVWKLRLSSMTVFNKNVGTDPNILTWKTLFLKLGSVGADPVNHIIRLTFDPQAGVPALLFSIVGQVGDGGRYDEEFYNQVIHAIDQGEPAKVVGEHVTIQAPEAAPQAPVVPVQAEIPIAQTAAPVQTAPVQAPVQEVPPVATAPVQEVPAAQVDTAVEAATDAATDAAMDGGAEDVSNLLALFK